MFPFLKPQVPTVQPEEVKRAMDAKETYVLLDVRTQGEYSRGKLDHSINVPLDELAGSIETQIADKNTLIYVYCLSGSRSAFAVDFMKKKGYERVFDMNQGLLAWRAKGFPVNL